MIFSGNKELFKNQWIYDKIEWNSRWDGNNTVYNQFGIEEKKYYEKYIDKNKKVILLGMGGFREKEIEVLSKEL